MKIAIIGAGIFGSTTAIKLAESGFAVDLYEKELDILQAASGINQYRLHRGYHYPRSAETALSSKRAEKSFRSEYGEALLDGNEHYYCIAQEDSKVSKKEFLDFCDKCNLEYKEDSLDFVDPNMVQLTIKAQESLIDPIQLRKIVWKRLYLNKVNVILGKKFSSKDVGKYGLVINCSYANLNHVLTDTPRAIKNYQFELCEKPILKLPKYFKRKSVVIMDGPFFCIDPYANTGLHLMGNVVHALHRTNVGIFPEIPKEFKSLLNKGIIKNPPITNISKFMDVAKKFMPKIRGAEHIGSMYTVRTVLPNVDCTDERPTIVKKASEKIINVFSGKMGNCVETAEEIVKIVNKD